MCSRHADRSMCQLETAVRCGRGGVGRGVSSRTRTDRMRTELGHILCASYTYHYLKFSLYNRALLDLSCTAFGHRTAPLWFVRLSYHNHNISAVRSRFEQRLLLRAYCRDRPVTYGSYRDNSASFSRASTDPAFAAFFHQRTPSALFCATPSPS